MAEFHVGDKVRFTGVFSWMKGFEVTEIHQDGEHYTGEGRAWWHENVLDYDLSDEAKEMAVKLERAFYDAGVNRRALDEALVEAHKVLPLSAINEIRRASEM